MKSKGEVIDLKNENFMFTEVKTVDSKFRLNLGQKVIKLLSGIIKSDGFQVFVGSEGDLLLRPTVNVPSREAWVYKNPKAIKLLRKGFKDISEGRTEEIEDADKFFDSL